MYSPNLNKEPPNGVIPYNYAVLYIELRRSPHATWP